MVVTDARTIQDYYRERYGKASTFIPYGAEVGKVAARPRSSELGLEPGRYFLYVSRLEPENHPLEVRQAFERVATPVKLALVGDAPYAQDYILQVRDTRDSRARHTRRHLWRWIPRAAIALLRLHPRHRGRRHASGAD